MHDVHSICFVNTDFRSLTITCIIYTCYKCLACESKMASILNFIVGSSEGCPLNCPLFLYLKVVGYPLSCPLYPYMEVVGSLICISKFQWATHGQPTPLPTKLPIFFFIFGSSGLPTELPTVSIYGRSGQPNLHGSPLAAKWAAARFFFRMGIGKGFLSYQSHNVKVHVYWQNDIHTDQCKAICHSFFERSININ